MDHTNHANDISMEQLLSTPTHNDKVDSPGSPQELKGESARPRTAGSSIRWEEGTTRPRPLSIRTCRTLGRPPSELTSPTTKPQALSQTSSKQKSSIFNLFAVKEPSSRALREYEDALKRQQNNGKGRPSAVGLPMTSATKLPANVPKVNSKWDGLPEAMHRKQETKTKNIRKTAGSNRSLPSAETLRSTQSDKSQRELQLPTRLSGFHGNKKVASLNDMSSFQSDYRSLNQSSTSTTSWKSTPTTPSSICNFLPKTRPLDSPVSDRIASGAQKSSVAVVNLSSSKNSPDAAVEDPNVLAFPFPDSPKVSRFSKIQVQDAADLNQDSQSKAESDSLLSLKSPTRPASSQSTQSFFSKFKKKKASRLDSRSEPQ